MLYADVEESSVDEASRRVIECVSDTTSKMLVKASAEDVKSFQAYTIRRLDQKQSSLTDTEHFKLINVKENAMSNKLKRAVGIYIRIPMYSVMGGAPVGCSPRIKGGVPGRAIVKFLHFCIMVVECRFGRAAFFFFSSALC